MSADAPAARAPRPAHHRPGLVALVAAGGAAGTAGRYGLSLALPVPAGWPVPTLVANVVGAFCLGALLEALLRRGPETPRARTVRLGLGTGLLGGFTTFSSLAFEVERLLAEGSVATALGYAAATLVLGFTACALGVAWSARRARRRSAADPAEGAAP